MTREPMLLFLGAGLALAVAAEQLERRVVWVGQERTQALIDDFEARQGRPPTEEEARATVDAWIDRELAIREAHRLELDRGDPVVRRRLLQKMAQAPETTVQPQRTEVAWVALEHEFDGAFPHGREFTLRPASDYDALFGEGFGERVASLTQGVWTPVQGRYGVHQVRVSAKTLAPEPSAGPQAAARLQAREEGVLQARQARREAAWVWY